MDELKSLKESLPQIDEEFKEDVEKTEESKPSLKDRRKMMRDEAVKIFREKFITQDEIDQIEKMDKVGLPKGHSFYLPDFVPNEKADLIPKLLMEMNQAQKIDHFLKQKFLPKLSSNIGKDEVVTVKASDLKTFMEETFCERKRAEEYMTAARGDLQMAYRLFIENVESGDERDLELSLIEGFDRDDQGRPM
jgi:hypothetical protein